MKDFESALREAYLYDPCGVLPNVLWKTLRFLQNEDFKTDFDIKRNKVNHLEAANQFRFFVYWDAEAHPPRSSLYDSVNFALVHNRYIDYFPLQFQKEAYFRLAHNGVPAQSSLPSGFRFRQVNMNDETEMVAHMLNSCYDGMNIPSEEIMHWTTHPVFIPDLWVWIEETDQQIPVALGIGEYDRTVPEVSLEWIQVLPEYRKRGLGKSIMLELLQRSNHLADIITVSGRVESISSPESLYRSCGFVGNDVWWVLRK